MSDPSVKTHTNEARRTISAVESLRAEIAQLRTERDKLAYMIEYIERLDPVIVGWARAGFQQEAKNE